MAPTPVFGEDEPTVDVALQFVLREINDKDHSASFDMSIMCIWEDTEAAEPDNDEIAFKSCSQPAWIPHFHVNNSTESTLIAHRFFRHGNTYFMLYNALVLVHQVLELERFPFDRQIMEVQVESANCRCRPWQQRLTEVPLVGSISCDVECVFESILETWVVDYVDSAIHGDVIELEFGLERLPEFFVYNVGGFLFILSLAANATTAVDIDDIADRLSLAVTLMLAVIAFKFVVVSMIPPTAFITLLDKYILSSMGYIFLVLIKDVVWSTAGLSQSSDRFATLIWACIWILVHVVLAVASFRGWFLLDWDQVEDDQVDAKRFPAMFGKKLWNDDLADDEGDEEIETANTTLREFVGFE